MDLRFIIKYVSSNDLIRNPIFRVVPPKPSRQPDMSRLNLALGVLSIVPFFTPEYGVKI